jgi:hypothetical protein
MTRMGSVVLGLGLAVLEGCAATDGAAAAPGAPVQPQSEALAGEQGAVTAARDVAAAVTNVMSPEAIPPTWANRVGSPSDAFKSRWASLVPGGKGDLVATLLDVGAVTTEAGARAEVQAKLIVLSDGRVRWSTVAAREGAKVDANPTPGLATTEPVISALLAALIHRLDAGPCQVPFLSGEELLSLPATLRGELGADIPTFAEACGVIRRHRGATWGPILEAAVVVLREGPAYVAIASHFQADTTSGRLVLEPLDVAPVTGSTMELAWGDAPAAQPPTVSSGIAPAPAPAQAPAH